MWHASSRGVASNNLELENAKAAKGNQWESNSKLKESKQKLQKTRKNTNNLILFCVILWYFWRSHDWHSHKVSSKFTEKIRRKTRNSRKLEKKLYKTRKK